MQPDQILTRRTKALRSALNDIIEQDPNDKTLGIDNILKYNYISFIDQLSFTVTFKKKKRNSKDVKHNSPYYWEFINIKTN